MRKINYFLFAVVLLFCGCSSPLVQTIPERVTDTGKVTITCDATQGNKGLLDFKGPVFVHVGLITDSSLNGRHWQHVKYAWGTADDSAKAIPVGDNKWAYTIQDIRQFFNAPENEKILKLAILFRSGNCLDTFCRVLRNEDRSDIFIPINSPQSENATNR